VRNGVVVCILILGGALLAARSQSGASARQAPAAPISFPAQAAAVWQSVGPYGGRINALARNPKNAREFYTIPDSFPGQIFKSSNSGSTWKRVGLVNAYLSDIIVHPTKPNIIYGVASNALYTSTDQGRTFTGQVLPNSGSVRLNGNISISPRSPDTIYIAGSYKYNASARKYCLAVYRSKDGGQTWTVAKLDPVSDYTSYPRVAASPARAGLVFASEYYYIGSKTFCRVFKSSDGGNTWKNVTGSIGYLPFDLAVHPKDPNKVYVTTSGAVYRSLNGGQSWAKQESPPYLFEEVLAVDSKNPQVLYGGAVTADFVYKSTDGGVHWAASKPNAGFFGECSRIVADGSSVLYASWAGIFKSANGGQTWRVSHSGIKASIIPGMALAPASPKTVYVESQGYACFKSANAGGAWTKIGNFAGCGQILKVVCHPATANTVYLLKGG
jgi:photosystem II stability/assembly factor-like uncharacterized protein